MIEREGFKKETIGSLVAALALAGGLLSASAPGMQDLHRYQGTRLSMACVYAIDAYGRDAAALRRSVEDALDEVDRVDRLMSHYRADSALSRINRQAASRPVVVEPELFDFIQDAMQYTRASDGAFDITVGPLMKVWGFFGGDGRLPAEEELNRARRQVGSEHVALNPVERTIAFDRPGVELDLGGIGKGYAVDRAARLLKERAVVSALISAGGSTTYGMGVPPNHAGWEVSIQDPTDARKTALTVTLTDRALSVAGTSEKSFDAGGVTYSHIMNPRTGRPVQGVLGVAVLATSGTAGDALDDAFFVLGPEDTRARLPRFPGAEAFFFLPNPAGGWRMLTVRPEDRSPHRSRSAELRTR